MGVKISLSVTQNSQSVTNNTSNVTVKVNYSWDYGSWNHYGTHTKYVTINGTKYSFNSAKINPNNTTSGSGTLYEKTLTISHNSDGTGKVDVYAYVNTDTSSGVLTKSLTKTLDTIPRASTVTATSAVVGSASTISISRKSSSFTHTLEYSFGSLSGTIATKTTSTSVKFTLPTTFYAQIGSSSTSKSGTITCKTYKGSTLVGTKTCSFTAKTSSGTCAPTLSPTVKDVNTGTIALTGDANKLIKYYSTAAVTFGASARNSATLSSKKVTNSGKSRTTDGNFTSVTSGSFVFTATDSRGYSTSNTVTKTMVNYIKPTCTFRVNLAVDGTGTLNVSGDYFNGSFGAVANTLTVEYRYKKSGGSYTAWTALTPTKSGNTYSASKSLSGFDYQSSYSFQARAIDKLASATPSAKTVQVLPVFDWDSNDFQHNTTVYIPNDKALASRDTSGNVKNLIFLSSSNNLNVGGGSYPPNNIYMRAASGGNIMIGEGDSSLYSLLGACRALCTTYTLDCTVTNGSGYSGGTASAYLLGNCLRLYFDSTRSAETTEGNITNETVMTININHGGKIDSLYRVSACTDVTGGAAHFSVQAAEKDENNVTVTVILTSAGSPVKSFNSYCIMPANLHLNAYV